MHATISPAGLLLLLCLKNSHRSVLCPQQVVFHLLVLYYSLISTSSGCMFFSIFLKPPFFFLHLSSVTRFNHISLLFLFLCIFLFDAGPAVQHL